MCVEDWKCDQYRWVNQAVTALPRNGPKVTKSYYSVDTPNGRSLGFQRHVFKLLDSAKNLVLVHYIGDEAEAIDFAHRSTIKNTHSFYRTLPSYLKTCADKLEFAKPNIVYKKEIAGMKSANIITVPRNIQQLRYLKFKQNSEKRISRDGICNLHDLAYNVPFVWKIISYPDLECILGMKDMIDELERVLQLKEVGQLLSYDTTFDLGDFYVSPLIFRHIIFKESPCIPALFLVHERKLQLTHESLFSFVSEQIPSLSKLALPLVTDREKAINNAIKNKLPNVKLVYCWNHLFRDIEAWCRKHNGSEAVAFYCANIRKLLEAKSESEYMEIYETLKPTWDTLFREYYSKCLHKDIYNGAGRWNLEKFDDLYSPFTGVTNNQSESLNR